MSASAKGLTLNDNAAFLLGTDLDKSVSVTNTSEAKAYVTLDVTSTPIAPPETLSSGFKIEKTIYGLSGDILDANKF